MTDTQDRVIAILTALAEGRTREEVAKMQGYQKRWDKDQYMRRHGYHWNPYKRIYVRTGSQTNPQVPARVLDVLTAFEAPNADARAIAKQLHFVSPWDMTRYMKTHGFVRSQAMGNYIPLDPEVREIVCKSGRHRLRG